MPIRILTPIIEARQQVEKKWIQATLFNVVESVSSMLLVAAISHTTSMIFLALAISVWKILFGIVRTVFVLRSEKLLVLLTPPLLSITGALLLAGSVWAPISSSMLTITTVILGTISIYTIFKVRFLGKK